jgi:oligosaccharide repeat unit polymerase
MQKGSTTFSWKLGTLTDVSMNDLHNISNIAAYLLAAILAWAIWSDIRRDLCRLITGRNVVLFAIGSWYLLEAIMLPAKLRSLATQEMYNLGIFYVGLAAAAFLLGYHYTKGCSVFPAMGEKVTFFDDETWSWRLVVFGAVIGFTPIVVLTGTEFAAMFQGMLGQRSSWGGLLGRGRYGGAREAFLMLEMFVGGVAPFATILLFSRNSSILQRVVCLVVIVWPILRAYGSGTRSSMIIAIGGSFGAYAYWRASPALRKKLIIGALACAPLFYALMAAIVESRGSGKFSWEAREKNEYVGNEMFRELLFISSKVPTYLNYQYGYNYYVQLVNPIPRFLWKDKPTLDSGLLMASMYGDVNAQGEAYLTVSPGLIGEMYLNFGVLGVIGLSFFGGWLVKGWDRILLLYGFSLPTMMFYSGGLGVLFIMGRSFTLNMFYGLLSLSLLAWLIRSLNPHAIVDLPVVAEPPADAESPAVADSPADADTAVTTSEG